MDNSVIAFKEQLDNGIHIPTFIGDKNDEELLKLIPLLKELSNSENTQADIKQYIGLSTLYATYFSE